MRNLDPITARLFTWLSPVSTPDATRAALVGSTDWERLLAVATAHRVGPLLLSQWRARGVLDAVPLPVRTKLELQYVAAAARAARLQVELMRILERLSDAQIIALPIRGPALAYQHYTDPVGRQSDDLDLLVARADLARAQASLLADGYQRVDAAPAPLEARRIAAGGACVLQHPRALIQVDLAWTLFGKHVARPLTLERLAPFRQSFAFAGQSVAGLDRETTLLLLCAHGAKHLWSRHAWTLDVAMLLAQNSDWHWEGLFRRAHAVGFARMLRFGLAWAHRTCGVFLPAQVLASIERDATVTRLCDALAEHFARDPMWFPGDDWERARLQLLTRERLRDRWRYLWRRALTPGPNDWRTCPLPTGLWPAYLILRPLRLAARRGRALFRA